MCVFVLKDILSLILGYLKPNITFIVSLRLVCKSTKEIIDSRALYLTYIKISNNVDILKVYTLLPQLKHITFVEGPINVQTFINALSIPHITLYINYHMDITKKYIFLVIKSKYVNRITFKSCTLFHMKVPTINVRKKLILPRCLYLSDHSAISKACLDYNKNNLKELEIGSVVILNNILASDIVLPKLNCLTIGNTKKNEHGCFVFDDDMPLVLKIAPNLRHLTFVNLDDYVGYTIGFNKSEFVELESLDSITFIGKIIGPIYNLLIKRIITGSQKRHYMPFMLKFNDEIVYKVD
jgi:hypothetical protein